MKRCLLIAAGLMCACIGAVEGAVPFKTYSIGNSLTWNLVGGGKLGAIATAGGHPTTADFHIRTSSPLNYIWSDPTKVDNAVPSTLDTALPNNNWDAVTMQPYVTSISTVGDSTLATDKDVIRQMIGLSKSAGKNANTRFFIYATWPNINFAGAAANPLQYENAWLKTTTGATTELTMRNRSYFHDLYVAVHDSEPAVRVIPAGEVLYSLDKRMRNGEIPGFSNIAGLYGDDYHLNALGSHIVAATAYATMFAESPVGLPYSDAAPVVTPASLQLMQQTVWDTVKRESESTGVPEPTAMVMLVGMGTAGTLLRRRSSGRAL